MISLLEIIYPKHFFIKIKLITESVNKQKSMIRYHLLQHLIKLSINITFFVCYLTTLSVSILYSVNDRMINECGAVTRIRISRGSQSTRRKPGLVPLHPPQISHDLTWDRTLAAEGGSRRLSPNLHPNQGTFGKVLQPYIHRNTSFVGILAEIMSQLLLFTLF
jgi:hypothetical protein